MTKFEKYQKKDQTLFMYEFIEGKIEELTPSQAVVSVNGIGYDVQISLNTYSQISNDGEAYRRFYIHESIREDAWILFGFLTKMEREVFRLLISVSGVGPAAARMILSSLTSDEIKEAIYNSDIGRFKSVKGIGAKTAERIIVDLRGKVSSIAPDAVRSGEGSSVREEAVAALTGLGFQKSATEKVVSALLTQNPAMTLEDVIRASLGKL